MSAAAKNTGLNIADLEFKDRVIEIKHPATHENIGIRVTLVSYDHERLAALRRTFTNRKMKNENKGKVIDADELESNKHDLAYTAMTGWEWYEQTEIKDEKGTVTIPYRAAPDYNGSVPVLSRANAVDIFKRLPWFLHQIQEAMAEDENFFGKSASI